MAPTWPTIGISIQCNDYRNERFIECISDGTCVRNTGLGRLVSIDDKVGSVFFKL